MYRTLVCLTEQHTGWVLPLAALVCWVSSHTALRLVRQSRECQDLARWGWLAAASFSAGAGIWSTHFIGMLGYDPGVVIGYDMRLTLLSLLVGILAVMCALIALRSVDGSIGAAIAGVILGLGIAAMHYSGMAGVEVPAIFVWARPLVLASVLIGCVLAAAAFVVFTHPKAPYPTVTAATLLTAAIASLHFTAMAAVEVVPDPTLEHAGFNLPRLALAFGIAAIMLAILGFAVLALFAERMRRANRALGESEAAYRLLAENTTDVIIWNDLDSTRRYVSPAARTVFGYEPEELIGTRPHDSVHPDDIERYREVMVDLRDGRVEHAVHQARYRCKDGCYVWIEASLSMTKDPTTGRPNGCVTSLRDVTARKEAEMRIAHMAVHDALTGLPNRALFRDRLNLEFANAKRHGGGFAVLACDLDRFKAVNDGFGHPAGDKLLSTVADRLSAELRDVDTVARLGGDEFAIILSWMEEPQAVSLVAERLIEAVARPVDLDGDTATIGVSIGIAIWTPEVPDADSLFKNADIALYRAKAAGRGTFTFFEPGMDAAVAGRNALERDMREAIRDGGILLHYQPIMTLADDTLGGFEALMRWRHPERGMVSPADFIPLAEETGLIVPLGVLALREACREAASWPDGLRVAVNVSPVQFRKPGLEQAVIAALAASGLAPQRLELEITESVLIEDSEATLACLHRLRGLGIRIALDDFGTGYSSLSYLRRFPFDKIKIDRAFIRDIVDPDTAAIVRAIVSIGERLGTAITAEGVETSGQLEQVRQEGCTEVQGFFYSKPLPAADASGFARIRHATRAAA